MTSRLHRIKLVGYLLVALTVSLTSSGLYGCDGNGSADLQQVSLGMEATAVNSLIYIAQEKGYFEDNGIELILKDDFVSGSAAAVAMLEGKVDIATAAEFAIVRAAFTAEDMVTLGSIDMFTHMKLVARKDRGIQKAADLVGKEIGVPVGSSADFFLGRFLDINGISRGDVTITNVQAPQAVEAITSGQVDAIVAWQPNIMAMQERMADGLNILNVQSGQPMYCALITTGTWADANPGLAEGFLRALVQAEGFLVASKNEGKAIIQARLGYDDVYMSAIWPEHRLALRLEQSLVLALEDQARWMINNGTEAMTMPDFLDYMHPEALQGLKPEAVSVIR